MDCPRCQHENPVDSKFCLRCGARLGLTCGSCGTSLPAASQFCNKCGTPVTGEAATQPRFSSPESYIPKHLAEKILTCKSALEGERKQVTVLFADLKGSMELVADRDPEEARKLLDPVLERMMEAVHRYEGTVNQVMGDGIMALFGAPLAHEDHAVRACYAALRMQESVKRYADEARRTAGVPLHIRVGLNSGDVVVRSIESDLRMDYSAVGQTTHLAARMEQAATPGSIVVSAETLRLAEGYVQVRSLGRVTVKGLGEPVDAHELTGVSAARTRLQAAAARGLTRFVGRDHELTQLEQALERARTGHGQIAALVGEPGVGKSRLVWEITHSRRTTSWLVLESGSVSYGKASPYLPVIDLLKAYFQIEPRDEERRIREKLTGKLLTLDRALEPTLSALLALLDVSMDDASWRTLDPTQRRQRTLDAVKRLLLREAREQPLLLIFEDLHRIDAETQTLLDGLIQSLPTARLLVLVSYRPEYQHGWGSKSYYTQLRLDPLPPESAEELLHALVGDDASLAPLRRLLIERTEGNPFYLEESVRTMVETQVLAGDRGAYRLGEPVHAIQVPATVQAMLAARIDRLPPEDKQLLQAASVIGKDVPLPLLHAIADVSEQTLQRMLARLQSAEFLCEATLFPEPEYTFKHALTHEVAYQSLLQGRQRALHARILSAIETLCADRLAEQVERLAYHALRAALPEPAIRYLRQAGAKAVARSANREAVEFLEQTLQVLAQLPETRETLSETLDVRLALGPVIVAVRGSAAPEAEASYLQARELCHRLEDTARLFPVLWGLWYGNYGHGRYRAARELGERLLDVARGDQDDLRLLEAHHSLWATLMGMGEAVMARAHLEKGLALYDPTRHGSVAQLFGAHDPGACCRWYSGLMFWQLGYPDQALAALHGAVQLARELAHPLTTVIGSYVVALVHALRGEVRVARDHVDAMVALATTHGTSDWVTAGSNLQASLMVEAGRLDEGIAQLERGLGAARGWRRTLALCFLADAFRRQGEPERGLPRLAEGLTMAERDLAGFHAPELYRLWGELVLQQTSGDAAQDAEVSFRRGMQIARARQQKSLELRAATSLGRLLADRGNRTEARRVLGETYGWFNEGFETRDVREAKLLLDQL